jgi:Big-like domain-containing protein/VCBS repeat protein/FG-GAP repeat protein/exosortase sorting signal-containing protein
MSFQRPFLALCLWLLGSTAALAQITFAPAVNYPAGSGSRAVAVGDFNGDGRPDLVVANPSANSISILLASPTVPGTFAAPVPILVGSQPNWVVVGHFNSDVDNFIDIAVANAGSGTVSILPGNGDGTFAVPTTLTTIGAIAVVAGDFNGDGRMDLATTRGPFASIAIHLGVGDGTFVAGTDVAGSGNMQAIRAGDFNGDGRIDLAALDVDGDLLQVYLGQGFGAFTAAGGTATCASAVDLAPGELNGNNRLDVAIACSAGQIDILLGNGNGTFAAGTPITLLDSPRAIAIADFDRDGRRDLVVAMVDSDADHVAVLKGNGNGTFAAPERFDSGATPLHVATGDFNADGRADIVTANASGNNASVFLNTIALVGPAAPTALVATAGDTQAIIGFTPPTDALSLPIIDYTVTCMIGTLTFGTATGAASPITVTGMINSIVHSCTVRARNANGIGEQSLPVLVRPQSATSIAIATSATPVLVNESVTFTATMTASDAGPIFGFLSFRADGVSIGGCPPQQPAVVPGGTPTCTTSFSTPGTKVITAQYNGTSVHAPSNGTLAGGQVVNLSATSVAVTTSLTPVAAGVAVTFTATVTGTSPTGTVTFKDGGVTICDAVGLSSGSAQCTVPFAIAGTKAITAEYSGDGVNATSTGTLAGGQVVSPATSSVALATSAAPVNVGAAVTFTATVTGFNPTGTVNFMNAGVTITGCGAVTLAAGSAQCTTSFASAGTKGITADYSGDAANTTSSATLAGGQVVNLNGASVQVTSSIATAVLFAPVTYTASVTGTSPTGTVNFRDSPDAPGTGTTIPGCGAVALVAGQAQCTFTYDASSLGVRAGFHFISADYSGDASNQPATGSKNQPQLVDRSPTTTSLVSTAATVGTGVPVTFTATVGPFLPAGNIDFRDGGVSIAGCNAVALVGDTVRSASCTTSFATPGTKAITGVFSGNGVQAPSTGTLAGGLAVTQSQVTTFTGPTATGTGNATVSFTGGGSACTFAPQGTGATQSAFFIPVTGHAKSPPTGTAPPGVAFPQGLLDFVLTGCTPGSTMSFTITYPTALPGGARYWKYGPTAGNTAPHWYQLPANVSGTTVTFTITDGGLGDDDLAANGTVVDQGGPGTPGEEAVRQVPTLSEWAMLLLALLMLTFAARRLSPYPAGRSRR